MARAPGGAAMAKGLMGPLGLLAEADPCEAALEPDHWRCRAGGPAGWGGAWGPPEAWLPGGG